MNVLIKDREKETEQLRLALNMSGISVNYQTTDLIKKVFDAHKKHKGNFNVSHCLDIERKWEQKWHAYFKPEKDIIFEDVSKKS